MAKATKVSPIAAAIEAKDITAALKALSYTPVPEKWDAKDDKAKWQEITKKKNEQEVKAAKKVVNAYASSDDAKSLPPEVVAGMIRLSKTSGGSGRKAGGSANPFMDNMRKLFPKVGTAVSEIDVFVATKMGRGEMRAKVRQNLTTMMKSAPDTCMWIEFNADTEEWVLLSIGAKQPKGWQGKAIVVTK